MKSPDRVIPSLETLEARSLPATFAPTSLTERGASTLRNAVLAANADTSADDFTITLRAGTYALTRRNTQGQENAAARGDLDVTTTDHKVVISGVVARGRRVTVIDATVLRDRVFQLIGPGVRLELRDLVIKGGLARDDGTAGADPGNARGGGVLNNGGSLTLVNVLVTGNRAVGADAQGGGVYSDGGAVVLDRNAAGPSALTRNRAAGANGGRGDSGAAGQGGGMYAGGGTVALNAVSLVGNIASGGIGGRGVAGSPTGLSGSGTGGAGGSGEGGGLYTSGAAVSLTLTTFSGNRATGGAAGAGANGRISHGPGGGTTLGYGGSYGGGTGGSGGAGGSGTGGGLYSGSGTVTLLSSTFSANVATGGAAGKGGKGTGPQSSGGGTTLGYGGSYGGAGGSGGTGGNGTGGGLYSGGGTVTLLSSTFSANLSSRGARGARGGGPVPGLPGESGLSEGGGIAGDGVTVRNTISARNRAGSGPDYSGAAVAASGNLLGNGDGATGFDAADGNQVGSAATPINPRLGKFGLYGGPTATYPLLAGSPAIDAGDDAAAAGSTDQRGAARVVNGIDIGAFERQADLRLTASVASVKAGGKITYSLTVTNLGPDSASSLALTSVVPAGATFVSLTVPRGWRMTTPAAGGTGPITATLPALAKGGRARLMLVVRVGAGAMAGGSIDFTATIGSALDPVAGNNAVNLSVPVVA